jgi:hypothetical protein
MMMDGGKEQLDVLDAFSNVGASRLSIFGQNVTMQSHETMPGLEVLSEMR